MQTLVSGEGVELDLPLAGPGSRAVAAAIDLGAQLLAAFLLLLVVGLAGAHADPAAITAFAILTVLVLFGGYPVVMEWTTRGRTLGKLAMGLRVVRDDAGPIGFRQAFVRGVCSLVLEKPGVVLPLGTAAGLVTAVSSPSWKRIGDLLAGTVVIQDRRTVIRPAVPVVPSAWLWQWAAAADLSRIDDDLALALRAFVERAHGYRADARAAVELELAARVVAVVSPPPPQAPAGPLLVTVLAERRRRASAL